MGRLSSSVVITLTTNKTGTRIHVVYTLAVGTVARIRSARLAVVAVLLRSLTIPSSVALVVVCTCITVVASLTYHRLSPGTLSHARVAYRALVSWLFSPRWITDRVDRTLIGCTGQRTSGLRIEV